MFCEDDLVLSKDYMWVMEMLAERFANDPRVGMISAHPAQSSIPKTDQHANTDRYAVMGHNWAYALSRKFWLRRQPFVEHYLDLIRTHPYGARPHNRITNWPQRVGFRPAASSQDYIKSCATRALGAIKLATYTNFGTPIGRNGVHSTDELFKAMGSENCVVFDGTLDSIPRLTDSDFQRLFTASGHQVGVQHISVLTNPETHKPDTWEKRLLNGYFPPGRFDLDVTIRRTESCPCGSSKRFKHCCGTE